MAEHIEGPLYYETMGKGGPVMAFVHPNPMDQSCWIFQMAEMSTWYRCIAIDLLGYGRSPKASAGLTTQNIAQACWDAIDDAYPGERAILVGCSIGSSILIWMHNQRPQQTAALIMCGTGYNPNKEFIPPRIEAYKERGIGYRWGYTFEDFSPAFRSTPMAHFFAKTSPLGQLQWCASSPEECPWRLSVRFQQCRRSSRTMTRSGSRDGISSPVP
jgi:pimeloyl-ACP methyl ester carboxylesterase